MKRHRAIATEEPEILEYKSATEERNAILDMAKEFRQSEHNTLGILCRTQKQAKALHKFLQKNDQDVHLLSPGSSALQSGILITSAHLAKGLEFDQVIGPHVSAGKLPYRSGPKDAIHRLHPCITPADDYLPRRAE